MVQMTSGMTNKEEKFIGYDIFSFKISHYFEEILDLHK